MAITLTFDLNDRDLEHFTSAMERARKTAEGKSDEDVIGAAAKMLEDAQKAYLPDFIRQRLVRLDDMIAMIRDTSWNMSAEDRARVLSALVYFSDPVDVIPDHIEVLGYFDDAIMIELSVRELKHELDAYDDFCDFREREAIKRGSNPSTVGRTDWLESRREELTERMHQRRERDFGVGYGGSSGYGRSGSGLSGGYARAWRPGVFKW